MEKAIILRSLSNRLYILVGVTKDVKCITDIEGITPSKMICLSEKNVRIIENPAGECLTLGPPGALNNVCKPKILKLVGQHTDEEIFIGINVIPYEYIEPKYK